MEETLRLHLLELVAAFHAATGITAATVGKRAVNDNTVFGRLRDRVGTFNVRTYDRLVAWMDERWPADFPRPPLPADPAPTTEAA